MKFLTFYLLPILCQITIAVAALVIYRRIRKSGALVISVAYFLAPVAQLLTTVFADQIQKEGILMGPESIEFTIFRGVMHISVLASALAAIGFVILAIQLKSEPEHAT